MSLLCKAKQAIARMRQENQEILARGAAAARSIHEAAYRRSVLSLLPRDDPFFPVLELLADATEVVYIVDGPVTYFNPPDVVAMVRAAIAAKYGIAPGNDTALLPISPDDKLHALITQGSNGIGLNIPQFVEKERQAVEAAGRRARKYAAMQTFDIGDGPGEREEANGPPRELDIDEKPAKRKRKRGDDDED